MTHDNDLILWFIITPIIIGGLIEFRWAWAYSLFPAAVERMLREVDIGAFGPHASRFAGFVKRCGNFHKVMGVKEFAMAAIMLFELPLFIQALIGALFWLSLLQSVAGAEYSVNAADLLEGEADAINRFVRNTTD